MFKGLGLLFAAAILLAGCGATSSGTGSNGGGTTHFSGQAQGVYSGTMSNGNAFQSIVLPNDKFYEVYGTLGGNPYSVSGMVTGQGASGNGTFAAGVTELLYTGQMLFDNLTASVVPGATLGGTLIQVGQLSGLSFSGTALPASSFLYNTPASLSQISGNWSGTLLDGTSTTVTISAGGGLNGSASGCLFTGTATADPSNNNFFDATVTFGGLPCALANQTATGIAVNSLLPDGVTQQFLLAVTAGVSEGTVFLAHRPNNGSGGNLAAVNGQYGISLAGFDQAGNPVSIAGSIKADGLGHIVSGEVDTNDNGAMSSNNTLSGTYAFDPKIPLASGFKFNGNGQGTLGTMALTYMVGSSSHALAFAFSLQASGGFGQIMSLDTNNFVASGTMQLQNSAGFALANMAGDYAVELTGKNAANPTSAVGRFTLASGGATTNVTFDRGIAGIGAAGPTTGASASLAFSSGGPDANGRGTCSITINDALANTTLNFVYYTINAQKIIAVESDGSGTMTAEFSRQNTPFVVSTIATSGSVFAMSGADTAAAGNEIAAVGQLQITATGAHTGTLLWDSNDGGIIVGPASFANQTVPIFDTATGRGTINIANGAINGLADSVVFYLTAPGTGFLMDTTTGVFNRAMAGTLTAQVGGPYSASTDLAGLGIVRSKGGTASDALSLVGLFGLTTTPSTYAFEFDQRFPKSSVVQTQMDQSAPAGILVQTLDPVTGRGMMSLPIGSKTANEVFYILGPSQFVFLNASGASSGVNGPSGVYMVNAR
jgi:hypothetical protein